MTSLKMVFCFEVNGKKKQVGFVRQKRKSSGDNKRKGYRPICSEEKKWFN